MERHQNNPKAMNFSIQRDRHETFLQFNKKKTPRKLKIT